MKTLIANRALLYMILNESFRARGIKPIIAELGVMNGENALTLDRIFSPQELFLIDAWSAEAFADYHGVNGHRPWVNSLEAYASYFGGPVTAQQTFDDLHAQVTQKFSSNPNTKIVRATTRAAAEILKQAGKANSFDLIYVDASHQYETVFDDLMFFLDFLKPDGFYQLNDCCYSPQGLKQNLGVLEAAVKFCKVANFKPVLLTNTDWTDVVFVRADAAESTRLLNAIVEVNDIIYVEVPDQLLGALQIKYGKRHNVSFA